MVASSSWHLCPSTAHRNLREHLHMGSRDLFGVRILDLVKFIPPTGFATSYFPASVGHTVYLHFTSTTVGPHCTHVKKYNTIKVHLRYKKE